MKVRAYRKVQLGTGVADDRRLVLGTSLADSIGTSFRAWPADPPGSAG